jgi:Ca2+-binding EF-hand superfamily protein
MKKRQFFSTLFISAILLTAVWVFAQTEKQECSPDELFQACDKDKDGKISKEEWDTIDSNKDNTITSDEWDKYKYKSTDQKTNPFQIRYYDVHGDGTMGKEEFQRNFKRLQ